MKQDLRELPSLAQRKPNGLGIDAEAIRRDAERMLADLTEQFGELRSEMQSTESAFQCLVRNFTCGDPHVEVRAAEIFLRNQCTCERSEDFDEFVD